ncbi:hypothetical protein HYX06_05805 [Candidatus Woesearchaeota archaeon]|nr:hypothetical protein [Candidatus Woesearchaeota archaeon]
MKSKKSQGLSVNVIILAALALAVLLVLIVIFTRGIGKTSENLGSCITKQGQCANKEGKCPEGYQIPIFVAGDCKDSKPENLCCIRAG